jgi:hypothetical protein
MRLLRFDPFPRLALAASLSGAACFAEPRAGSPSSGTEGDTGPGLVCPLGSSGCPCDVGGGCDAGLECNADGNCIDPRCVPGTDDCVCLPSGGCDVGLLCADAVCKPSPGGTDTGDDTGPAPGTSGNETGPPVTSTDPMTGPDDSTGPVATSNSESGPGETSVDPGSCVGIVCEPTLVCSQGACVDPAPYDSCLGGCETGVECLDTGKGSSVCAPTCIASDDCPPAVPELAVECLNNRCVAQCNVGCPGGMGCGAFGPFDICTFY